MRVPSLHHLRYAAKARAYAPVTYLKRVVLGRDPYWRRYFWNRWGYVTPADGVQSPPRPLIWLEAYGGEITQLPTVCRLLGEEFPQVRLAVSTNNRFSFEFARRLPALEQVFDTPWDLTGPMRRALRGLRPSALAFVDSIKYPVLARLAAGQGIPVVLINGFLSQGWKEHAFMRRAMHMGAYRQLTAVAARSEEDAEHFTELGIPADRIVVTGNLKFDPESVRLTDEERRAWLQALGWNSEDPVFVAGGVRLPEYAAVAQAFQEAARAVPSLKLIIAPSFDHRAQLDRLSAALGGDTARWSDVVQGRGGRPVRAVIVDTFGDLPKLYGLGTVAFVGSLIYGSAGLGHNLVEPLLHGVPTLVGPYVGRWEDIVGELKQIWHGVQCLDAQALAQNLQAVLQSPRLAEQLRLHIRELAQRKAGAVERTRLFLRQSLAWR
ncbi:MAG: hypothetical protein HYY91_04985 [Candidatus Omnitrophica bacterium]|nr:hypothetical protein [Candidatus Omnitrophota bacterium]